jgi:hypothetical protein
MQNIWIENKITFRALDYSESRTLTEYQRKLLEFWRGQSSVICWDRTEQGSKTDRCKHIKQTTESNNSWSAEREQKIVENKQRMKCRKGRTQVMISRTQIPFGKKSVVLTACTE